MADLVAFLRARIDEDEAAARAAEAAEREPWQDDEWADQHPAELAHYARHDPARVLREVAAKRAILEYYLEPPNGFRTGNAEVISGAERGSGRAPRLLTVIEAIALDLAAGWSDHLDHDPAWATGS